MIVAEVSFLPRQIPGSLASGSWSTFRAHFWDRSVMSCSPLHGCTNINGLSSAQAEPGNLSNFWKRFHNNKRPHSLDPKFVWRHWILSAQKDEITQQSQDHNYKLFSSFSSELSNMEYDQLMMSDSAGATVFCQCSLSIR